MRNPPRLLLYIALVIAVLRLLGACDEAAPLPLIHADYQGCTPVTPGPIQRPDGYTTEPFGRKKDQA